jgi:MinD-like ATPase involved in chromosome partitioning or flagellar assembly
VLRGMYDFVIIDTPAHFSEHVLTAMDVSSHLVLLTTPDVTALKSLRVTLDMLDMLSYPRQIRLVVVNRADSKVGISAEQIRKVVRSDIAAHIPSSRAIPVSVNKGVPIMLADPGHPISQSVAKFVQQRLLASSARGPAEGRSRSKRRVA